MMERVIGGQRLVCADNLEFLPMLEDCSFDLVATDATPPA